MLHHLKYWAGRIVMLVLVAFFVWAFAATLPIDFALLAAVDMALYVDALFGVYVIANVTKLRATATYNRLQTIDRISRLGKRARRVAGRVAKILKKPANDDRPALAWAA